MCDFCCLTSDLDLLDDGVEGLAVFAMNMPFRVIETFEWTLDLADAVFAIGDRTVVNEVAGGHSMRLVVSLVVPRGC